MTGSATHLVMIFYDQVRDALALCGLHVVVGFEANDLLKRSVGGRRDANETCTLGSCLCCQVAKSIQTK